MGSLTRKNVDDGFEKANSNNLPTVNIEMVAEYFSRTTMYANNESSGIKAKRSLGPKYGDEAIGRVQVKINNTSCCVMAEVTPEHKISSQPYKVVMDIDLKHIKIKNVQCKGCLAALGGCKHAMALIGWLHRRSEEPSPTEQICYWKKAVLASVDTSRPYDSDAQESSLYSDSEEDDSEGFVSSFAQEALKRKVKNCHFLLHYDFHNFSTPSLQMSLHHLMFDFLLTNGPRTANTFISFCKNKMNENVLKTIVNETKGQYKSPLWRELRYGRITGSLVYEVAHSHTKDGSTIDKLFGRKFVETKSMKRGRDLESQVKSRVQELLREKISETGLWLNSNLPIFGASPDGIGTKKQYCVEIKCPATDETYRTYIKNGKIVGKKFLAQVQLQMHLTNIAKTKFCVADPKFEITKKVEIIDVYYDRDYVIKELIVPCTKYWSENMYEKISDVVK